jgi:uncharacterized protein (DUF2062 family)
MRNGTSQSTLSHSTFDSLLRPRPSRSLTLHHSFASLAAGFVVGSRVDWTPRLDAIFASPLALRTTGNQYRLVATADYRPSRSLSMAGSGSMLRPEKF